MVQVLFFRLVKIAKNKFFFILTYIKYKLLKFVLKENFLLHYAFKFKF